MLPAERRMAVYALLQEQKHVSVTVLAEKFGVSGMTIRRDLSFLKAQGVAATSYGGATLLEGASAEPSFLLKGGFAQNAKDDIAREAALFVKNGEFVYVDCGTTTLELMKYLMKKTITILTNSWLALSHASDFSKARILLAPGVYDPVSGGGISAETIRFLREYHADKAFLSTMGVDRSAGATVASPEDAEVKRTAMSIARQTFLLADHTKFDTVCFASHGRLDEFGAVLTDEGIDRETMDAYRAAGANMILCRRKLD